MTEKQAESFAREWYRLIDAHAPVYRLLRMTAEDFTVEFPGRTLSPEEYAEWYIQDIRSNFNGAHTIHRLWAEQGEGQTAVHMELTWRAETWTPPAARSEAVCMKPNVSLILTEAEDGSPRLSRYLVTDREE